ncbi:MAG: hypothetical protein Q9226_009409, partial [Calogaya cf. arnoldii]
PDPLSRATHLLGTDPGQHMSMLAVPPYLPGVHHPPPGRNPQGNLTTWNSSWFPPNTTTAENMAPKTQSLAEMGSGLRASTLLPEYDCLFHEHHGFATCSSTKVVESVRSSIMKAWQCFDKKRISMNPKGDAAGDVEKSQEFSTPRAHLTKDWKESHRSMGKKV